MEVDHHKVPYPVIFTLCRLTRRRGCLAVSGVAEAEEVEEVEGEAGTQGNFMKIHCNFSKNASDFSFL